MISLAFLEAHLVYKLASRYRHYSIALLMFSSQVFKEIHPLVD